MNQTQKNNNLTNAIIVVLVLALGVSLYFNIQRCEKNPSSTAVAPNNIDTSSGESSKAANIQTLTEFPYFVLEEYNKKGIGKPMPNKDFTSPISSTKADSCIDAYKKHSRRLTIYNGLTLKGYEVNVPTMRNLFSKNPETLFLEFGVKPELLTLNEADQSFTLIISGYDKNNNIIKDGTTEILYEYIRPCPPNCPR